MASFPYSWIVHWKTMPSDELLLGLAGASNTDVNAAGRSWPRSLCAGLNAFDLARRISQVVHVSHPEPVRHAQEKIAHRDTAKLHKTPGRQPATPAAREDHRQVDVSVTIGIRVAAAIHNHGVVQE